MTKRKTQYIAVWKKTYAILKKVSKERDEHMTRILHDLVKDFNVPVNTPIVNGKSGIDGSSRGWGGSGRDGSK